jgi:signal transduction histidine kinase
VPLENGFVRVEVSDNGTGVPDNQKQRIFDEFKRGKHQKVDGLGLGLSIVKRVVDRLNGEVGVRDANGGGSVFWFALPDVDPVASSEMDSVIVD